ncbi:proton-conducting transporter transmembrane domain-containing protein [Hippea jasoniae]|uniref:proton-conducting transporter transmembrane domain-containing protein n=1 Tax=Hippea jasoniae TaxID=944479 RepID=UPI0005532809|nr:proton-conducting transporter membrane subunit [Hippea jasoniae]
MIILYLIGAIAGFFNRKISYIIAFIASTIALFISIKAAFFGYSNAVVFKAFDSVYMGFLVDKTTGLFLFISSLSFMAVSLFSIDFGMRYSKRMAVLLNLDMLGMVIILYAHDMLTFLIGWEVMTISSYLLIVEHKGSFKEAFQFLSFSELSTLSLIIAAIALFRQTSGFVFPKHMENTTFLFFASFAFIVKMGILPFHTWLKQAHAKAPSNVSALLSAPVTLMGVYGLVRVLGISGYIHSWGIVAIILGSVSAFFGAIGAASAKGLKVLPAYSTVENNGMILSMLGFVAIARHLNHASTLADFAFIVVIMLSLAHTVAKTLLFLSVGQAKEQLNEENIDNVRGIHRSVGKIPALGIVISGLSFSAFPGLIGYVAEWMMLEAIFQSYQFSTLSDRIVSSTAGVLLSLAAGFASFAMIKLIGYSAVGYHHNKKAIPMPKSFMQTSQILLMLIIIGFSFFASRLIYTLGYKNFIIGALGVPQGWLIASAKPVFGVISPAFFAIVLSGLFIVPLIVYLKTSRTTKRVVSFNGGLSLQESEYFTANAFSFTIEYILRILYRTKEIIQNKRAYVQIIDIFETFYTVLIRITRVISYRISIIVMNSKIHIYIAYMLFLFIAVFIIFG